MTRPILDLCERSAQRPGAWVSQRWWDQEGLYLEVAKERVAAESDGEDLQCKEGATQGQTTGQDWGRCVLK